MNEEWDKVFPKSEKVNHKKLSFKNHFGITLVADQYEPKEHDAEFIGLDLSPEMIKQAESKNIKNAKFVEGRSDMLPFENDSFDIVTCSQSFHHYPETDKPMQEAKRVLKPGGLYILSDTGCGPFKMLGVKVDSFIYRHFSNTGDCNISYMEKTVRDMERNGFSVIKFEKLTKFIYTVVGKKI